MSWWMGDGRRGEAFLTMIPETIPNWINGSEVFALDGGVFSKLAPATGLAIYACARSQTKDVENAVQAAKEAQAEWGRTPAVARGVVLLKLAQRRESESEAMAKVIAEETGRSLKEALGEVGAAVQWAFLCGRRATTFGRTMPSGMPNRTARKIREPIGVAGLIVAANTPLANIAWKVFPALICGNGVVLKV